MREFASMRVEKVRVNKDTAFFHITGSAGKMTAWSKGHKKAGNIS